MSDADVSPLPGVRRIITGHNEAGVAVVRSEDVVAPEVRHHTAHRPTQLTAGYIEEQHSGY